jgi:Tfp pilus assembly protein PilF
MKDMNKAVEIDPENPYRYSSRAYIRSRSDIDGAIADYEKAVEIDPKDEIAFNNLGLLQENAGRMKSAQKNYKKSNSIIGYDPDKRKENTEDIDGKNTDSNTTEVQTTDSLFKIMLSVFTSKKGRKEYFNYLKSLFKK